MTAPMPEEQGDVVRELAELKDLFVRRLYDDRDKRRLIDELAEQLKHAETGPFRQYLQPVVYAVALLIDRVDRYQGPDLEFADSVREELLELLRQQGVREVAVGEGFDPAYHEVVEARPDPSRPRGEVLSVRRRGFAHGGWVFRPAQVVVSQGIPPPKPSPGRPPEPESEAIG